MVSAFEATHRCAIVILRWWTVYTLTCFQVFTLYSVVNPELSSGLRFWKEDGRNDQTRRTNKLLKVTFSQVDTSSASGSRQYLPPKTVDSSGHLVHFKQRFNATALIWSYTSRENGRTLLHSLRCSQTCTLWFRFCLQRPSWYLS